MIEIIIFYIVTLFISTSLLLTWFQSSLPNLIFHFIKKIGIAKYSDFWKIDGKEIDPMNWDDDDWSIIQIRLGLLGHLLSCQYCLCYHICFWITFFGYIYCLIFITSQLPIALISILWLTQPLLVHFLINKTVK